MALVARSQRGAPAESLATLRTGERPLLAVGLLVQREVGLLAEFLATVSALKRLLARSCAACGAEQQELVSEGLLVYRALTECAPARPLRASPGRAH